MGGGEFGFFCGAAFADLINVAATVPPYSGMVMAQLMQPNRIGIEAAAAKEGEVLKAAGLKMASPLAYGGYNGRAFWDFFKCS